MSEQTKDRKPETLLERADALLQEIGSFFSEEGNEDRVNSLAATSVPLQLTVSEQATRIKPPTKFATITTEELEVVRCTTRNVYAPHMPNLIKLDTSNLSKDFISHDGHVGLFMQEREMTDFTVQAAIGLGNRHTMNDADFVFRFSEQIGEGYRFFVEDTNSYSYRQNDVQFTVEKFRTRSELTSEPLSNIDFRQRLILQPHRRTYKSDGSSSVVIGLVAQEKTIDLYVNLTHVVRVETATLLQGKFGFMLFYVNSTSSKAIDWELRKHVASIKVWEP